MIELLSLELELINFMWYLNQVKGIKWKLKGIDRFQLTLYLPQ